MKLANYIFKLKGIKEMDSIVSLVVDEDYGNYYLLTKKGYILLILLMILTIIVSALIIGKKQQVKKFDTRRLSFAAISLALAFVTSYIKFELPMGGAVTLFSMFFICFIGYLYGIKAGFLTAFAFSLLQFLQSGSGYFLSPFQICCDYIFAFTALGIAGFGYKKKGGLVMGYVISCLVRGLFHTIGGYMYWMDYMPESFPKNLAIIYPIVYNYFYILTEMIITLIVINIPAVKKVLKRIADAAING